MTEQEGISDGSSTQKQHGDTRCSNEIGERAIGHAAMQTPKLAQMRSTNARKRNDGVGGWRLGKEATLRNTGPNKTGRRKEGKGRCWRWMTGRRTRKRRVDVEKEERLVLGKRERG